MRESQAFSTGTGVHEGWGQLQEFVAVLAEAEVGAETAAEIEAERQ